MNYRHEIEYAAQEVFRTLGGNSTKVEYKQEFVFVLERKGLVINDQKIFVNTMIGNFTPDLWINGTTALQVLMEKEIKAKEEISFVNHLTVQRIEVGYMVNFYQSMLLRTKYRMDRIILT